MSFPDIRVLSAALRESPDSSAEFIDPETHESFVIVRRTVFDEAMESLRREADRRVIAGGLEQADRGEFLSATDVVRLVRAPSEGPTTRDQVERVVAEENGRTASRMVRDCTTCRLCAVDESSHAIMVRTADPTKKPRCLAGSAVD